MTAKQHIWALLKKNGRANKAAICLWEVRGEDKKTVSPETIARKLRELEEEGWVRVDYERGQAFYTVNLNEAERNKYLAGKGGVEERPKMYTFTRHDGSRGAIELTDDRVEQFKTLVKELVQA